jgi:hypothetical protein
MPIGALIGGLVAQRWGLRAPYYVGAATMLIAYVIIVVHVRESAIRAGIRANTRPTRPDTSADDTPPGIGRDPLDDLLDPLL